MMMLNGHILATLSKKVTWWPHIQLKQNKLRGVLQTVELTHPLVDGCVVSWHNFNNQNNYGQPEVETLHQLRKKWTVGGRGRCSTWAGETTAAESCRERSSSTEPGLRLAVPEGDTGSRCTHRHCLVWFMPQRMHRRTPITCLTNAC